MVLEHTAQRIAGVAQQMPPVGDLKGLRRPLAGPVGVGAGAIAHDDRDGGMVLEPGGQGLALAVGQQIEAAPTLEINQDRAVVAAPAPRPVIDPKHARCRRRLQAGLADAAQQGRAADRHAGPGGQPRARLGAQGQGDGMVSRAQPVGMTGSGPGKPWQALAERASWAGVVEASEAPDPDEQDDGTAETRQIAQAAPVMAMHAMRSGPAVGAVRRCCGEPRLQADAMTARVYSVDDVQIIENSKRLQGDQLAIHRQ
jgi:hypothetical protein